MVGRAHAQADRTGRVQTDVGGTRLVRRPVHQSLVDDPVGHRARPIGHHPHLHGPTDHRRHRQPAREQTESTKRIDRLILPCLDKLESVVWVVFLLL